MKVFHSHIRFWMELDVQGVFITNVKLMGNSLFVRDERSRCHSIDLANRRARNTNATASFLGSYICCRLSPSRIIVAVLRWHFPKE